MKRLPQLHGKFTCQALVRFFQLDFLETALWHVEESSVADASSSSDDWESCLAAFGVNQTLQEALLTEDFRDIRCTATCKFWVAESLELSYEALRSLND